MAKWFLFPSDFDDVFPSPWRFWVFLFLIFPSSWFVSSSGLGVSICACLFLLVWWCGPYRSMQTQLPCSEVTPRCGLEMGRNSISGRPWHFSQLFQTRYVPPPTGLILLLRTHKFRLICSDSVCFLQGSGGLEMDSYLIWTCHSNVFHFFFALLVVLSMAAWACYLYKQMCVIPWVWVVAYSW